MHFRKIYRSNLNVIATSSGAKFKLSYRIKGFLVNPTRLIPAIMSIISGQTYSLINKKAHNAMDLSGGDNKSVIGYDFHGGDNQKWKLEQVGSQWALQNVATGNYLTVEGDSVQDGTPLVVGGNKTVWDIWPDGGESKFYRISIPNTQLNIDLSDHGNPTPGTPVTLWIRWEADNQCWEFSPVT